EPPTPCGPKRSLGPRRTEPQAWALGDNVAAPQRVGRTRGGAADSLVAGLLLWPQHEPYFHLSLPFHLLHTTGAADKLLFDELVGRLGDLNTATVSVGLHAAGGVDRVTPEVVDKLSPPDDPGHDRTRINPDAEGQLLTAERMLRNMVAHFQCH